MFCVDVKCKMEAEDCMMNNEEIVTMVDELVARAHKAQAEFESFSQEQVDEVVRAIGKVVYDRAEELAKMAVEESGMGVYDDKVTKCLGKSKSIWNNLKGKKSVGIIGEDKEKGLIYVAKAKGVIAAVSPVTNPVVTPMCNGMFALKGQNAIIMAPHPRAERVNKYVVDLFRAELARLGAPVDLFQTIEKSSIEATNALIKKVDVVVATGGAGMVTAAYSSGKPALGVGPGNVQVIIDRDVNLDGAIPKIIAGRTFDNGIICSGEQAVMIPKEKYDEAINVFRKNCVFYVDDEETAKKFADTIFPENGPINRKVVGQSVQTIAHLAGVEVPENTRMILIKARSLDRNEPLCREKMCPVMIAAPYDTFENAVKQAQTDLNYEGKGHTASLHSNNLEHIKYAGEHLTVSRLIVNQPSSTGAGGSFYNGFNPTTTLGCGSWGNNSISENLNYNHLINVSQIGLYNQHTVVPTDKEIWG